MSKIKKSDEGLFIPSRQLSAVMITLFSFGAAFFIAGYFLGKHHLVEPFVAQAESDSFADQIYASLCSLKDAELETAMRAEDQAVEMQEVVALNDNDMETDQEDIKPELPLVQDEYCSSENTNKWHAQLIGYGHEKSAREFAKKLEKKGFSVSVVTRTSSTAKGVKRNWYQVVTDPHEDKNHLQQVVDKIVHDEKLKGVQISIC